MGILPYMVIFCSILKQDPGKWCLTKLRLVGLTSLLSYLIMSSTDELARWSTFDIGVSQLMSHDEPQQEDQQFDDIDEFSQNIALNNRSPLKTMQSNNWALKIYRRWSSSFNSDAVHGSLLTLQNCTSQE